MKRAFTMIEILVCVAIVTILSGLILASLTSAKTSAKLSACQTNLKQISTSLTLYASDNDDAILVEVHPFIETNLRSGGNPYGVPWDAALLRAPLWPSAPLRYGAVRGQFQCPLDSGMDGAPPAFKKYGTSYLNDTLGGLVFRTFSSVPDSSTRTLLFDGVGNVHGLSSLRSANHPMPCMAYDSHVRAVERAACASLTTEVPDGSL